MRRSILLIGSLALAACSDGPTDPDSGEPGSVRFSYQDVGPQGTLSGSYHAEGNPDLGTPPARQTYADGRRIRSAGALEVHTNVLRPEDASDFARVVVPQLRTGSWPIDPSCGTSYCPGVFVALEVKNVHGSQARYSCTLQSGTVRITSISRTRAEGEFSGSGSCIGAPGVEDLERFSVSGGRFDVKLRDVQS